MDDTVLSLPAEMRLTLVSALPMLFALVRLLTRRRFESIGGPLLWQSFTPGPASSRVRAAFLFLILCAFAVAPRLGRCAGGLRQHRRHGQRSQWRRPARRHRQHRQSHPSDHRLGRDQRIGHVRQGAAASRRVQDPGRADGIQDRGRAARRGWRRLADPCGVRPTGRSALGRSDGDRRRDAAHDRSRRRGHAVRCAAADGSAGARSQLHQVPAAHARARSSCNGSTRPARTRRARPRRW